MPDYRAVIIHNGQEADVRVGTLEDVVTWAETMMMALGAEAARISKVDKEDGK